MSVDWLHTAHLRYETESCICAAQEQVLATGYIRAKIIKDRHSGIYRLCKEQNETVMHIVSGCKMLAGTEYLHRHNNICKYIHYNILRDLGEVVSEFWYQHKPNESTEIGNVTIMYDMTILTDRNVKHNVPDICIWNRENNSVQIIDVAVPMNNNVVIKTAEKLQNIVHWK